MTEEEHQKKQAEASQYRIASKPGAICEEGAPEAHPSTKEQCILEAQQKGLSAFSYNGTNGYCSMGPTCEKEVSMISLQDPTKLTPEEEEKVSPSELESLYKDIESMRSTAIVLIHGQNVQLMRDGN